MLYGVSYCVAQKNKDVLDVCVAADMCYACRRLVLECTIHVRVNKLSGSFYDACNNLCCFGNQLFGAAGRFGTAVVLWHDNCAR